VIAPNGNERNGAPTASLRVSIDGPAGSGKTTIGKGLAAALSCAYVDTGLMYRAVTWQALSDGLDVRDEMGLAKLATGMDFSLGTTGRALAIGGLPPGPELRSRQVDAAVSQVSAHAAVRHVLVVRQREMARGRCIVMVGRDIGTVVLPDAEVKLWIVASAAERARRRLAEHLPGMSGLTLAEAERRIVERDALDTRRDISPLKKPENAVEVDTGSLTPAESLTCALEAVRNATSARDRASG
jgi:cytidylate kinase